MKKNNRKKRLLMCYHSAEYGGVERQIYDLIVGLSSEIDFYVACPHGPLVKKYLEAGAIEHIDITPKFEADLNYSYKIMQIIKNKDIDIIHSHELLTGSLATFGGWLARSNKRIYHVHTPFVQWQYSKYKKYPAIFLNTIVNWFIGNVFATHVLALNKTIKDIRINKELIRSNKIHILPNGVDIDTLMMNTDARSDLGISDDAFVIGNMARFTQEKGHCDLVKAFSVVLEKQNTITSNSKYNEIKLLLAGGGVLLEEIKSYTVELGIEESVIFTDRFSDQDKAKLLHSMDLFVFPTHAEGFGIAVIEAMAAGLPVLASDLPVLHDVCGESIEYVSGDLSDSILNFSERLVNDEAYRRKAIDTSKNKAIEYSYEIFYMKYKELYLNE